LNPPGWVISVHGLRSCIGPVAWNNVSVPAERVWRWPPRRIDLLMPSSLNAHYRM